MELKPGEVICDECEGATVIEHRVVNYRQRLTCPKCHGTGKLDWVSIIVGKENPR